MAARGIRQIAYSAFRGEIMICHFDPQGLLRLVASLIANDDGMPTPAGRSAEEVKEKRGFTRPFCLSPIRHMAHSNVPLRRLR